MSTTNFPNGVSSFGVPVLGGSILTTGNIFFVDSGAANASDNPSRGSKDEPFATIDYAIGRCTANNGDHIIAMPGHTETITAAGGVDFDVAGVTLVGLGRGANQAKITSTSATGDIDIDAADITIEGMVFTSGVSDNAVGIDVNAQDFTVRNCRFVQGGTDLNTLKWILEGSTTTASRMTIENNYVNGIDASNTHFVDLAGTGDGHIIRGNVCQGVFATMCIGGAGIVTKCTIAHNLIHNTSTTADTCINMGATATGIVAWNGASGGHATDGIVCGDLGSIENYYELSTSDLSGVLEPAVA